MRWSNKRINLPQRRIIQMYLKGATLAELGEFYDVNWGTIRNRLVDWGITLRRTRDWQTENLLQWRRLTPDYQYAERNPNWKGGLSRSTVNRRARASLEVAARDMYTCEECGKTSSRRLNIHHIDRDRSNDKAENLEVLCVRCHNSGWAGARHVRNRDSKGAFICGSTHSR